MYAHNLDPETVDEVLENAPKFFPNLKKNQAASHMMIGPDNGGKFWTIFIKEVDPDAHRWRVITGWESESEHIQKYRRAR